MRRLMVVGFAAMLFFIALVLPSLTSAVRNDRGDQRASRATSDAPTQAAQTAPARPIAVQASNFVVTDNLAAIAKVQRTQPAGTSIQQLDREELKEAIVQKAEDAEQRAAGVEPKDAADISIGEEDQEGGGDPGREMNPINRERIRYIDPGAPGTPDAALAAVPASTGGKASRQPLAMPTPNTSFNGIGNPDGCGGCLPPDTNGDIGPTQYVQTVNTAFRVFSRTGTALTPVMTLGSLWAALPGVCANTNDGDPIVMYDQMADRWFISQFCWSPFGSTGPDHQIIAVSKTGDATGQYYLYDFTMPNVKFNDYPHFGIWPDGYYMTDNQFNQAGTAFQGTGVFAFDRSKMLAGDPTASYVYFDKAEGCTGNGSTCLFGGMLPADMDGYVTPPAGAPAPIVQFEADEFGNGQVDSIRLLDFHVDFTTPANSTLTEHAGSPLSVAAFDPREVPSGSRNVVPQPAGSALDAISDRLMFRLAYRNFGTHESLAMNHTVNAAVNPLFRAGVRYYEVRKTSLAGAWAVQEQATMAGAVGDLENRWMGSTALNLAGSQAVAYSVSSATTFTSVRYAGRLASDPAGSLAQGEATMVAGAGAQTSTSGRWGDYSDLTVDPLDDCTFWYTQEYYSATSGANWNTRIGSFQFGPCPAIQKGVLSGTVTSAATGNPITNATVLASNGFSRASAANGVYSIDPMASGTVSLTTSATNYLTANTPGVVVTTGNTTTQNIALTPLNSIVAGTGSVASDSCNSNATLDPNETVTVNLAISNVGGDGATTTNLTGTLQATGGVTSPSGPQNYGAVVSGGPAVSKSFTFTVGATCGGTVTATLSLQDGATNYGTLTYTFQVGQLTGTFPSTGGIAVAIPDNTAAGVDIPITVVGGPTISDVNVRVRINHTFDADLNISLVHPDGTSVALSTARGSSGDNFGTGANDCSGTPTVFDDAASTTIALGSPPYAGSFKPEAALSAFNGKTSNGTWKLHVVDTANLDTGTVGCVTLEINRAYSCCGVELAPGNAPAYSVAAESVSPANNALDPDETVTVNFFLKNVGGSNATNVVATLQPGGGVSAPSGPQSYGALTSLGPAVSKPFTFAVNGSCGGTVTATLALQDGATTLAPIQFTIPIGATSAVTQSFSNPTPIVIPATGTGASTGSPATPYPSNITVSGMSGVISKVTVTIPSISHTFPSDVDMLLVGPGGQKYIFLSDVIGGTDWVNISYTLDDAAAGLVPSSGTPASGTFKPTNYGTGDAFPSPAPASPYDNAATAGTATFASVFNGASPNGTWSLYVVDDAGTDIGTMATGWTLNITAQGQTCNTQACTINVPPNITTTATGPSGAVVNYTVPTCTGACGAVTSSPPSGSTFPIGTTTVTVTGTRADNSTTTNTFTVTVTPNGSNGNLLISEFRLRGPGGTSDEFIEVYNNTNTPHTVSSSGGSAGYAIVAFDGTSATLKCTIPNGTVIPARGHYLCVNSAGYSLSGYPSGSPGGGVTPAPDEDIITVGEEDGGGGGDPKAPPSTATGDATYTADTPDNAAITLFNNSLAANWTAANRLDAVAPASISDALYKEGTGLPALTAGNVEGSWVRRLAGGCAGSMSGFHNHDCTTATLVNNTLPAVSGFPQDTGDNSADFIFVEANGTAGAAGSNQRLGGPGPENLASPLVRMSPSGAGTITASLIDSCTSSGNPPNRERTGSGNSGTLAIRRRFTNYTGATVTRLRFRVMDISTSPVLSGGGIADLRAVTSSDAVVSITCGGSTTVRGVTLESLPTQTGGGGFNSSLSAGIISTTPLAPGATVDINFLFNIFEAGKFRAFIIVEALP